MTSVRFRVDLNSACSIGPGKIQLLESIERTGSLRQAASALGMSYRRAWLLLNEINQAFNERAALASIGGVGGGGVVLTPFGNELVARYRAAARRIENVAKTEFAGIAAKARPNSARERKLPRKRLARSDKRS
jgi:molybdate transport system regulatory protein